MTIPTFPRSIPETCAVALKEWAGVCGALRAGRQILLIRKGGIADGPRGFEPEHAAFWLYPTAVHEAEQGLRPETPPGPPVDPFVTRIDALVQVHAIHHLDRLETLDDLAHEHVWTEPTLARRFAYRAPGLWLLTVRVWRQAEPHLLPVADADRGCKSWVPLGSALPTTGLEPVLSNDEFLARAARLQAKLDARRDREPR